MLTALKPFKHRNFSLLMLTELLYRTPVWMGALIFGLLIKQLVGNSTFYEGAVGFAYNIPLLLLPPFTGVPNTIDNKEDAGPALSVFTAINRALQFIAYALGGFLFTKIGPAHSFWLSCVGYALALLVLFKIRAKQVINPSPRHPMHDMKLGFQYSYRQFAIRATMLLLVVNGTFAWPYLFQMPIVNGYYLHGTPETLGLLLALGGLGGMIGSIMMAFNKETKRAIRFIQVATCINGISLIALSFAHSVITALPFTFSLDLGMSILMVASNIFIQSLVKDEFRARVMGLFMMANIALQSCHPKN